MSKQAKERPREAELPDSGSADVRLEGLRKAFGDVMAVDGLDLDIPRGEFFTLLGPSQIPIITWSRSSSSCSR